MRGERAQEAQVGAHAEHLHLRERFAELRERQLAVRTVRDELRDERVVVPRDRRAFLVSGIDADPLGPADVRDATRRGQESTLDVLGVETHLDRVPTRCGLAQRQPLAHCDTQLLLHQVDVPHELRHGMLDLEARVHLEEREAALRVDDELGRSGVGVLRLARDRDRCFRERLALRVLERRRGRLLEDLLVTPLGGAVALAEREDLTVRVGEKLHLDVPRSLDELLEHEPFVAERRRRDASRLRERVLQRRRFAHA